MRVSVSILARLAFLAMAILLMFLCAATLQEIEVAIDKKMAAIAKHGVDYRECYGGPEHRLLELPFSASSLYRTDKKRGK